MLDYVFPLLWKTSCLRIMVRHEVAENDILFKETDERWQH